ncbi:MAG TPA: thioesterase family protein [Verrucomicrobiae bacterium]
MLKPSPHAQGRLIKRKLPIQPAFHETDMMGVIHNSNYFLWFERGRLEIMLEVLPVEEAMKLGVFMPVVENICHYRKPVKFGMPLLLYTSHNLQAAYEGRLVFSHYLIHEKLRTAMAFGQTAMTLVDAPTNKLIKEWPAEIWRRYQVLK